MTEIEPCINFYNGRLGNKAYICSCGENYLMGEPNIGDLVSLPFDAIDTEQDVWVIIQKYITSTGIDCFCKMYDWEV